MQASPGAHVAHHAHVPLLAPAASSVPRVRTAANVERAAPAGRNAPAVPSRAA